MDVSRALDQIAEIHEQMAKGEIYRGYRSLPVAASGLIGFAAGWLQPPALGRERSDRVRAVLDGHRGLRGVRRLQRDHLQLSSTTTRGAAADAAGRRPVPASAWRARYHRVLRAPERDARAAAAGPVGDLLRSRDVRVAAVSAEGERLGRAVLLRGGIALLWIARGPEPLRGWWVGGTFGTGQLLAARCSGGISNGRGGERWRRNEG